MVDKRLKNYWMLVDGEPVNMASPDFGDAIRAVIPNWAEKLNMEGDVPQGAKMYEESAWAHACIEIRMDALAQIPWTVEVQTGDEPERLDDSEPLVRILDRVDWRAIEGDLLVYGAAYLLKVPGQAENSLAELRRLNPATMEIKATSAGLSGFVQEIEGRETHFEADDILYFHEYDPANDFGGVAKAKVAESYIKAEVNSEKFVAAFFKNYAIPPIIFTTEQDVGTPELKKRRNVWQRFFQGPAQQHKPGFMDKGLKPEVIGYPVKDLALEVVKQEARRSICSVFRVPPAIVGAWEAANYATAEQQRLALYQDTTIPRSEMLARVINRDLVQPMMGPNAKFVWLSEELPIFREDMNEKLQSLARAVEVGAISADALVQEMAWPEHYVSTLEEQVEELEMERRVPEELQSNGRMRANGHIIPADIEYGLRDWRRKVLQRMKRGQPPTFDSGYDDPTLPATLRAAVSGQLEECQTDQDVIDVFQEAITWAGYPNSG